MIWYTLCYYIYLKYLQNKEAQQFFTLYGHLPWTCISWIECYLDNYSRHERHECRQAYLGWPTAIPRYHHRSFSQRGRTDRGLRGNYQLYNQRGNQIEAAGNLLRKDITPFVGRGQRSHFYVHGSRDIYQAFIEKLFMLIQRLQISICVYYVEIFLESSFFLEFNLRRYQKYSYRIVRLNHLDSYLRIN